MNVNESGVPRRTGNFDKQIKHLPVDGLGEIDLSLPIIEMASPRRILSYLPKNPTHIHIAWPGQHTYEGEYNHQRKDPNHPLGQWSLATTSSSPAVLYDDGAAFCSPTLAFDQEGSAIHCHSSPLGFGNFNDLEQYFLPELPNRITEGRISFVMSGSNVYISDEEKAPGALNPIDWAVEGVKDRLNRVLPGADFYPLISKQYDNQYSTDPVVPEKTPIRGFVFIPRYIATDDRNHVLVIDNNTEELRETFYWTKLGRR